MESLLRCETGIPFRTVPTFFVWGLAFFVVFIFICCFAACVGGLVLVLVLVLVWLD